MINETQNKNKVFCAGCGQKRHAKTMGVWMLKDGSAICSYGVCKDCASNATSKMMQQCEARLLRQYPQIRNSIPQDEIKKVESFAI